MIIVDCDSGHVNVLTTLRIMVIIMLVTSTRRI